MFTVKTVSLSSSNSSLNKVLVCLSHEVCQLDKLIGISPLIVIPSNKLNEFRTQLNTSLGIEAGGNWIGNEILRESGPSVNSITPFIGPSAASLTAWQI